MQQVVTVNDDFRHLNDGVPPHIARFIVAGEYDRALRLIEEELEAGNRPEMEPCLRAEHARIRQVFPRRCCSTTGTCRRLSIPRLLM